MDEQHLRGLWAGAGFQPRWLEALPLPRAERGRFCESLHEPPRRAVRLRPDAAYALPFRTEPVAWLPRGRYIPPEVYPAAAIAFGAGEYYVQDAASMFATALLAAQPGEWLCDLCAAPGGKATALLEDLAGQGWLLVNEPIRSRLAPLKLNLARHGCARYLVAHKDPEQLADSLGAVFDGVLVDAPCSGQSLAMSGKGPAGAFSERTIRHCAARQVRILEAAVRLVRPGGRLVYATCTFSPQENEQQVAGLLQRHPRWVLEPVPALARWECATGCYRLWPHRDGCRGGFAARLIRHDGAEGTRRTDAVSQGDSVPADWSDWGDLQESFVRGGNYRSWAWPEQPPDALLEVAESGPEYALRKGKTWFPAYALAMRRDSAWRPRQDCPLTDITAERYLAGLEITGGQRGWVVARWRSLPLGWLKGDGKRLKNHLPKPARLNVDRI